MSSYKCFLEKLEDEWDKEITLKRNDFLINKGDLNTNLYLVKEGSLRVFIEDDNEEHTIRFGYKESIITAFDCFLTEKPTSFYIQALKKCELKVISKINYMRFVNSKKEYQDLWNVFLNDFMYQQIEREIDLITYSPQKRFNRIFKRSPKLFQEIPQKYIASYLRMAPETLSRILKNLD
ncbi:Crp/Fnr family transcriptional regulator [Tenacibaculum piscium]|uniref:Crp/Fnr family transcriptional regulator n=1 Tax=Tenacibaculum piscium TaxID=1458515 RepID=UPI001F44EC15|nr:Crp/Fnr family transcriptional regulator [Tenacibaculum piscium]MCG8182700.1 Crp/Fnr family transcriptional regulator [Tenacibaculum piscium]MCG8204092.1 Crp/Fnr family transcriptional regulator [Tenacibaculum piscium]